MTTAQFLDSLRINVVTDDVELLAELHRQWQPDTAETNEARRTPPGARGARQDCSPLRGRRGVVVVWLWVDARLAERQSGEVVKLGMVDEHVPGC